MIGELPTGADVDRQAVLRGKVDEVLGVYTSRPTLTVEETAEVCGVGRSAAYSAVKSGEIPSIRIAGRIVVPVPALAALLLGVEQ